MLGQVPQSLRRERLILLGLLLALSALAWGVLIWQSRLMMLSQAMGLTMGMGALFFLVVWIVMMVAMMFPSAAPMILTFRSIAAAKQQRQQAFAPTWVFVSAYLLVWSLVGVVAYLLALVAEWLAMQSGWLMEHAALLAGLVLLAAGLYQLSPLKHRCLARCRTPLQFILSSWRDGTAGAFHMGVEHGLSCLGCCWLLFVILFPLGIMNLGVMALVTALISAEKVLPFGRQIGQIAGVCLIAYGLLVTLMPAALPMAM